MKISRLTQQEFTHRKKREIINREVLVGNVIQKKPMSAQIEYNYKVALLEYYIRQSKLLIFN